MELRVVGGSEAAAVCARNEKRRRGPKVAVQNRIATKSDDPELERRAGAIGQIIREHVAEAEREAEAARRGLPSEKEILDLFYAGGDEGAPGKEQIGKLKRGRLRTLSALNQIGLLPPRRGLRDWTAAVVALSELLKQLN